MPISECQVSELKRAYQVLGLPQSASALSIKQTYHAMAKRWHPDRYRSGTPAHLEATRMMALINEAYAAIRHAPLRYQIETYPVAQDRRRAKSSVPRERIQMERDTLPVTDRLEFWVRFTCGAVFGAFMALNLAGNVSERPAFQYLVAILIGMMALVLSCGLAAARYGDRFWYKILERSWLWW